MTKKEWDELAKKDREIMYDRRNTYNCEECPENIGESHTYEYKLKCGQYNCWVTCHCNQL